MDQAGFRPLGQVVQPTNIPRLMQPQHVAQDVKGLAGTQAVVQAGKMTLPSAPGARAHLEAGSALVAADGCEARKEGVRMMPAPAPVPTSCPHPGLTWYLRKETYEAVPRQRPTKGNTDNGKPWLPGGGQRCQCCATYCSRAAGQLSVHWFACLACCCTSCEHLRHVAPAGAACCARQVHSRGRCTAEAGAQQRQAAALTHAAPTSQAAPDYACCAAEVEPGKAGPRARAGGPQGSLATVLPQQPDMATVGVASHHAAHTQYLHAGELRAAQSLPGHHCGATAAGSEPCRSRHCSMPVPAREW